MLLPSLHLMVVHPPTKPRVGGIASGVSLNNPEVAQAVRSSATNHPSSTCHSHPMGTRNPQYTAHKREPAGATREAGGIRRQAVKEATSQAVSEAGEFTCQLIFADHSRKGTCRFNSCCCGTRQGRVEDTVKGKLDSCESNLLVVKYIPRTRGVDPRNGDAIAASTGYSSHSRG